MVKGRFMSGGEASDAASDRGILIAKFNPSASPSLIEVSARLANDGCVLADDSKRRLRDGQEMTPIATIEISIGQSTSYRFPIPIPAPSPLPITQKPASGSDSPLAFGPSPSTHPKAAA